MSECKHCGTDNDAVEEMAESMENKIAELRDGLQCALAWIDAVPSETPLPTMPGFDRDWIDDLLDRTK